jgi:hypothetical protein
MGLKQNFRKNQGCFCKIPGVGYFLELFSFRKLFGIDPQRRWTGSMWPVHKFIKWQPSKSWSTVLIKIAKGVFHLLILVVNQAMDGAQQLTGRQQHAMTEWQRHWSVTPEILLACYGARGSTTTSLNWSGGHMNPYPRLLEWRWSLDPVRDNGAPCLFLGGTVGSLSNMVGMVTVRLGKSSSGRAARWREARVRGSVSIQKSGQEASLYRVFSPNNSWRMRTPIPHIFCFDSEQIRLKMRLGEDFSPVRLELCSVSALAPWGRRPPASPG